MKFLVVVFLVLEAGLMWGQSADSLTDGRFIRLRQVFDSLGEADPVYKQETDLSVGNIPLSELLRSIATVNRVNLCVKTTADPLVACNFNRAKIVDLLYFLCREYNLEAVVTGNIVTLSGPPVPQLQPVEPVVVYDSLRSLLSFDFQEALLTDIARRITRLTGTNVVVPLDLFDLQVSSYLQQMAFPEALNTLAEVNGVTVEQQDEKTWMFRSGREKQAEGGQGRNVRHRSWADGRLSADSLGRITARLTGESLQDVLAEACEALGVNYFFAAPVKGKTSIYVRAVGSRTFFDMVLAGSGMSCGYYDGVYVFGPTGKENTLVTTRILPLRYRSADALPGLIPEALKKDIQVQLFSDLNSLIVSGDNRKVEAACRFLQEIDKRIPLITIDVIIVDVTKSTLREAGIEAGLGTAPATTSGTLSSGVDMRLNAASLNRLIHSFNGFGSMNLGKVTPNFYMDLKFLEATGDIELRSTPRLATLNGHEATLKSGETRYYKEVSSNIIGTQNPIQSDSYTWKSIDADLSLRILPFVGQDKQITLEIEIVQSEFTGKEEKDAPPSTATRSFKSQIRVKDGEMVLLGGIERNSRDKSNRGLPFITRIPVLKWLLGSTRNNKVNQKLNIFIKPAVLL